MKNLPLKARLTDMADRNNRHNYTIGDYWNMAEEALSRIEELEQLASRWQKIADQRAIEVADLKHELGKIKGG